MDGCRSEGKFSELIDKAKSEGPQKITKHGRITSVVVAAEEKDRNLQSAREVDSR